MQVEKKMLHRIKLIFIFKKQYILNLPKKKAILQIYCYFWGWDGLMTTFISALLILMMFEVLFQWACITFIMRKTNIGQTRLLCAWCTGKNFVTLRQGGRLCRMVALMSSMPVKYHRRSSLIILPPRWWSWCLINGSCVYCPHWSP